MSKTIYYRHSKPPKLMSVWVALFTINGINGTSKTSYYYQEECERANKNREGYTGTQEVIVPNKRNVGPRYTFAGVVETTNHDDGTVTSKLRIGLARCSENDSFTKKKGRRIAVGRANTFPLMSSTIPVFQSVEEERAFNLGKMFYDTTEELIERLDNGYIKTID